MRFQQRIIVRKCCSGGAKALGVPVYELFGGPIRDQQRVYWSHCGTSRARDHQLIGVPPLKSMGDVRRLGQEVREKGFTALKTNIVFPGDPAQTYFPGFQGGAGTTDQNITPKLLRHVEQYIGTFKEGAGPDVEIALDLNFNFKPQAASRICRVLEPFDMMWIEIDMYDHDALREVKDSTSNTITSGENLFGLREYRPFFEARSMDVVMVDITMTSPVNLDVTSRMIEHTGGAVLVAAVERVDDETLSLAISLGARACVPRDISPGRFANVIAEVAEGRLPIEREIACRPHLLSRLLTEFQRNLSTASSEIAQTSTCPLTARELGVLSLVADGEANKEVAVNLGISERTVKNHMANILDKLGARSRAHAVRLAVESRWICQYGQMQEPEIIELAA